MLAEASTTELSKKNEPETFSESAVIAHKGGNVAKQARLQLEKELGEAVITPLNAKKSLQKDLEKLKE